MMGAQWALSGSVNFELYATISDTWNHCSDQDLYMVEFGH